jgi:UDP-2,4-diacetamido-2,4,6-trideoxy-beta-L-altropyranose hydrolase
MKVVFRADASTQIGTGHVMRCLTLADALRELGAHCDFVCRKHDGHLLGTIAQRRHHSVVLPSLATTTDRLPADTVHGAWLGIDWQTDARQTCEALSGQSVDWLVVDHYALDHRWEKALRPHCQNLMVIDDLADRAHDCDVLLGQNLGRSGQDYDGLLEARTAIFIGPQYALLRPEFAQLRSLSLARRVQPQLKHLLINMGGVDKDNATGQALRSLTGCDFLTDLRITVVMGPHALWSEDVKRQAERMKWPTQVLVGVNTMAQLMADSDLCIGAAGGTSWERCCLGLPSFVLVLADNQLRGAQALAKAGAAVVLDVQHLSQVFETYLKNLGNVQLESMASAAAAVSDGLGVQRIVAAMLTERPHD